MFGCDQLLLFSRGSGRVAGSDQLFSLGVGLVEGSDQLLSLGVGLVAGSVVVLPRGSGLVEGFVVGFSRGVGLTDGSVDAPPFGSLGENTFGSLFPGTVLLGSAFGVVVVLGEGVVALPFLMSNPLGPFSVGVGFSLAIACSNFWLKPLGPDEDFPFEETEFLGP